MKIFTTNQVKTLDRYTITNEPIASVDLMERAAERLLELMVDQFSKGEVFYIFVGPGNNGGDGLAVARMHLELLQSMAVAFAMPFQENRLQLLLFLRLMRKNLRLALLKPKEFIKKSSRLLSPI